MDEIGDNKGNLRNRWIVKSWRKSSFLELPETRILEREWMQETN